MKTSQNTLIIREDNSKIRFFHSSFEKELGEVINIEGMKWKVCFLGKSSEECRAYLRTYGKYLFKAYNFNNL